MSTLEVSGKPYSKPELLVYWILERENIRKAKEAGKPKPWSEDPVFQKVYFCNVHREDDRVTRWIRRNYTHDLFGDRYELAMCVARIFNLPNTLHAIKMNLRFGQWGGIETALGLRQDQGHKVWSGAYVITTHGRKMSKLDYCIEILQAAERVLPLPFLRTCDNYHRKLMQLEGFGSFLAAQVVADLKNTTGHWLASASDWMTFSAPGPGSIRGLSWYFDKKVTYATYQEHIAEVARDLHWRDGMQDLQNCLCEFDKYCRVLSGTGRSKRKYPGLDAN